MRHIISTALVAVVVSLVTVTAVGAIAQSPAQAPAAEPVIAPAVSNINAHKVDGKHAVGAKASRAKRAGKLVATNKAGYLPANIVKPAWQLIQNKPAYLADGQIGWDEIVGIPAGFADGMDDRGPTYTSQIVANETNPLAAGSSRTILAWFDNNIDVVYNLIPTTNYGHLTLAYEFYEVDGEVIHIAIVKNIGADPATFKVRALVFAEGITPAALRRAVKTARIAVKQGKYRPR